MAIGAIQKNNSNTNHTSVLGAAAVGGISGYALKWAIPVLEHEKNDEYYDKLSEAKVKAKLSKMLEIDKIRNSSIKSESTDTFIKLLDENNLTASKIKKLSGPLADKVLGLIRNINDAARLESLKTLQEVKAYTKSVRPTASFVMIGAISAMLIAVAHNVKKIANSYDLSSTQDFELPEDQFIM